MQHTTPQGTVINKGDVVRINDDSGWLGDCGLTVPTRRNLAQVVRPGPITILQIEGVGIRGCVDEFLAVVN